MILRHPRRRLTSRRVRRRWPPLLWVLLTSIAVFATSCTSPERTVESEQSLLKRRAENDKAQRVLQAAIVERLVDRLATKAAGKNEPVTMNILAMSGGGDYGAFGAGVLAGWGQAADAAYRRPDFDAVTGVSTGALLAPFAFVGTDHWCNYIENFYRNPKEDWVQSRGLLFFLPDNPSFMTLPGLRRELKTGVDNTLIQTLAVESAKGKALLIAATNLDSGTQQVWDLGQEAVKSLQTGDADRIRSILLASSAIPAVFPPVMIDDSAYADGAVTANVLLWLDPEWPDGFVQVWRRKHHTLPLPKVRYWVIINNQLHQTPKMIQFKWPEVLVPSLATSTRSATVAEVRWLTAQANYANAAFNTDIEIRVVAIPDEWRPPVPGSFKKETMESLTDLGRKFGAEKSSWELWATPHKSAPRSSSN